MAPPVWVLSVDLQTKTATFQSGMAEAAKTARYTFGSIGTDARNSGKEVSAGTIETRSALGLLDSAIRGEHSMAMSDFVRMFEKSSIVMSLIPFAAVAGGLIVLGEAAIGVAKKIHEMKEEQELLARSLTNFGTIGQNAFNALDEKLAESSMKADELRNDHLGALAQQLKIIDMQSMSDLAHSFDALGKEAATVFAQLKTSWYQFGIGAAGAKHALDEFTSQYDSLLSKGQSGQASSLLKGTAADAERVLAMQKQAAANTGGFFSGPKAGSDLGLAMQAQLELKKSGVGYTEKEIHAQEVLVQALKDQEGIEQRTNALKKQDQDNAKRTTAGSMSSEHSSAAKASASAMLQMGQQALAAEKSVADARLAVQRASIQARTQSDLDFATREYQMQLAANDQQMKALDKYAKDYPNQLKELQNKALEITQEHATTVASLTSKTQVAQNALDLANIEAGERQKIEATDDGSAARLAAIDAALKEERAKNMQDLSAYRDLQTERVKVAKAAADEMSKQRAEAGREAASQDQAMAELRLAAAQTADKNRAHPASRQAQLQQDIAFADQERDIKLAAARADADALDKSDKDYANKLKANLDKQKQLIQQHANEVAALQENAEKQKNKALLAEADKYKDSMISGLTQVLMRYQTFGQFMVNMGNMVASTMMKNAMQNALAEDSTKRNDAAAAARHAYVIGTSIGGPAGLILGPVAAAGSYAAVMAFAGGTDYVPGIGTKDTVPAFLTPGEGIVPGGVMDGLRQMARQGSMGNKTEVHLHHNPTYHVNTIDGDGMKDVLDKHSDQLNQHFNNHVRKMNR
jgi:hypothetical protein